MRLRPLVLLAAAALLPSTARAVIGGAPDTAHSSVVMVRNCATGCSICSGVLVNPGWVLTLATCVTAAGVAAPPDQLHVHADGLASHDAPPETVGAAVVLHPAFHGLTDTNVALLRLATPVSPRPAATPRITAAVAGETVTLVGFGVTSSALAGGQRRAAVTTTVASTSPDFLTVGSAGATACAGDMGAAVFAGVDGQTLAGVVNGVGSLSCDLPAPAIDAAALVGWIEATAQPPEPAGPVFTPGEGCGQAAGPQALAALLLVLAWRRWRAAGPGRVSRRTAC